MTAFPKPSRYDRPAKGESKLGEGLAFPRKRRLKDARAITAYKRAHPRCEGCGKRKSDEVHHIRSRIMGGDDTAGNFLALCAGPGGCHRAWADVNKTRRQWLAERRATMEPEAVRKVMAALRMEED